MIVHYKQKVSEYPSVIVDLPLKEKGLASKITFVELRIVQHPKLIREQEVNKHPVFLEWVKIVSYDAAT